MPLSYVRPVDEKAQVVLGLWQLTESHIEEFCFKDNQKLENRLLGLKGKRQLEVAATHALLQTITADAQCFIEHDAAGRPLLPGWSISVSHTKGYVAVILSKNKTVAVDIEYLSERVNAIADRFLREDEAASTTTERLIHWCAKETAFKYFTESNLTFQQMRIRNLPQTLSGNFQVDNLKDGCTLKVWFQTTDAFVLTFAY